LGLEHKNTDTDSGLAEARTQRPGGGVAGRIAARSLRRCLATLGGTTTAADCAAALRYMTDPRRLIDGPAIREFELEFARRVGVRYAYSFYAGRVALYALLRALGLGRSDEVLLQVPTHVVVANAVRYTGARPVYVDCRLHTYDIDLEHAERLVTPQTRAIIVQHTFGIPADIDGTLALAERHGLDVIEDCVHALGATYRSRQVGGFGRCAFFSTEETKTITTTMGGMAVTDDAAIARSLEAFQATCPWPARSTAARHLAELAIYHFLTQPRLHRYVREIYELIGERSPLPGPTTGEEARGEQPPNYARRLANGQAALGLRQLRRLDANVARRREVARRYTARLSEEGMPTHAAPAVAEPALVRYPVWVEDRESAVRAVAPYAKLGMWFTSTLQESAAPQFVDYVDGSCPRAEAAAQHLVNLPTNPRVTDADVYALVAALSSATSHTE
jgi:perosamine synthetase